MKKKTPKVGDDIVLQPNHDNLLIRQKEYKKKLENKK